MVVEKLIEFGVKELAGGLKSNALIHEAWSVHPMALVDDSAELINTQVGSGSIVSQGAKLTNCTIGEGSFIGANSTLNDANIASHCTVGDNSVLHGANMASYCGVGSDAVLTNVEMDFAALILDGGLVQHAKLAEGVTVGAGAKVEGLPTSPATLAPFSTLGERTSLVNGRNLKEGEIAVANVDPRAIIGRFGHVEPGSTVKAGAVVDGNVASSTVHEGAHIFERVTVKESEIGPHTRIDSGSSISNSVVGGWSRTGYSVKVADSQVGNNVRLDDSVQVESGSIIGKNSYLGDASKISNSTIGPHSTIFNLAKIYDSKLGSHTKVGYCQYLASETLGRFSRIGDTLKR